MTIDRFEGQYRFLSNFFLVQVEFEGFVYPSTEHAYQAAKTTDAKLREPFQSEDVMPRLVKYMGRELKDRGLQRPDWQQVNLGIMRQLLEAKFAKPGLRQLLLQTGDSFLKEGNYWHDNFWGDCTCDRCRDIVGLNHLGRLLMKVRRDVQREAGAAVAACGKRL